MLRPTEVVISATLVGFACVACSETPTETMAGSPVSRFAKGGKRPPPTHNTPISVTYPARAPDLEHGIYGDAADGSGTYVDGECGIVAAILGSTQDAWMNPDQEWNSRLGCVARTIAFDYSCVVGQACTPGTDVEASGARMTIGALGNVTSETEVWVYFAPPFCTSGILFDADADGATSYARAKLVTDPGESPRQWEVWASPGSDVAVCRTSGRGKKKTPAVYYHLPFLLVVTEE
jgi:hypothetical protein